MPQKKSLKKNALLNVIKTLMGLLFPLISFPYSSRILLPEGIGRVRFAESIVSYFTLIAALGINTYATREAAVLRDDREKLSKFVKEILTINIISMAVAYILLACAIFYIPKLREIALLIFICSIPIFFNTLSVQWLFFAIEEFTYITIRAISFQIVSLILLFVLVKSEQDYFWYASLNVFGACGCGICNFIYSRRFVSFGIRTKLEIKKHLKPVFTFFAMAVIIDVYTVFDTSMLGFLADETQIGYYYAATKINKMVLSLICAAGTVVFPRMANLARKEDKTEFYSLFYKSLSFVLCFSIASCVGLNLLCKPIVIVFSGGNFLPAVSSMKIMNFIIIAIGISSILGSQFFVAINKEKFTIYSVCLAAVVNPTLNFLLIPTYGAVGASVSTIVAESCVTIFQILVVSKYLDFSKVYKDLFEYIIATFFMYLAVRFVLIIIGNPYLQLLLGIMVGAIVYGIVLVFFKNQIVFKILGMVTKRLAR